MIARLKTRLFARHLSRPAPRDGLMVEDLLAVVALFALLFAGLSMPVVA